MSSVAYEIEIWDGESLPIDIEWRENDGTDAVPTSVRYRTFDNVTKTAIVASQNVSSPAADMSIVIPAAHIPANDDPVRWILLLIGGTFADSTEKMAVTIVKVKNLPAFA